MGPDIWVPVCGSGHTGPGMGVRVNGSSTYMGPGIWVCAYGSGHMGLGIWVQSYGSRHMGLPNVQPDFHVPCFMGPKTQDPGPKSQDPGPGLQDPGPKSQDPNPGKRICSRIWTIIGLQTQLKIKGIIRIKKYLLHRIIKKMSKKTLS